MGRPQNRPRFTLEEIRAGIDAPPMEFAHLITPWAKKERFASRADIRKGGFEILNKGLKKDLASVREVVSRVRSITEPIVIGSKHDHHMDPYIHKHRKKFVNTARGMPAERLLKHGSIPVPAKPTLEPMAGCHPQSLIVHKALTLLGFKPKLIQEIKHGHTHTAILVEVEGRNYYVDPFDDNVSEAVPEVLASFKVIPTRPMSWKRYRQVINQSKKLSKS
jgi:hypothetical protein